MDNYLPPVDSMSEAELRSEFRLLRQAVWDALAALGYDTDGDLTPEPCRYRLGPELIELARSTREDLRAATEEQEQWYIRSKVAERDRLRLLLGLQDLKC